MITIPKTLKGFNLLVDGWGFAGVVSGGSPPKLAIKTDDFAAGGMAAGIKVDTGAVEPIEFEFTMGEYNAILSRLIGTDGIGFVLRGAQAQGGTDAESVVYTVRGRIDEQDAGSWEHGKGKTEHKFKVNGTYARFQLAGVEMWMIDALAGIRVVNGVDQNASIREALYL